MRRLGGNNYSEKSDVLSLGCVLYEISMLGTTNFRACIVYCRVNVPLLVARTGYNLEGKLEHKKNEKWDES